MKSRREIIQETVLNEISEKAREAYKKAAEADVRFMGQVLKASQGASEEENIKDLHSSLADEPQPREGPTKGKPEPGSRSWIHGNVGKALRTFAKRKAKLRKTK